MILKHRDTELLRFEWVTDTRVRILSVNDGKRRFLPLSFGEARLTSSAENDFYAIRNYLRGKRPALFFSWIDFPYALTNDLKSRLEKVKKFRFKKHRHYNWPEARRAVLTGFLQKRISEICDFGREADKKSANSVTAATINFYERSSQGGTA